MDYGAHLKESNISHNKKSTYYVKQKPYKGSFRELRAKILFMITREELIPTDNRTKEVIQKLIEEGYIIKKKGQYLIS